MLSHVFRIQCNVTICEWFGCSHCLVYRLGGETLDVTVVQVSAGMYTISGTVHKSNLGGSKFTRILADYLASEFRQ
jgi:molecular chaperone DnaK (HSP70)